MAQEDLVELKAMCNPPEAVKSVLSATCLLLGYTERESKEWKFVSKILKQRGGDSLINLMSKGPKDCSLETALKVKTLQGHLTIEKIRNTAAALVGFFVWNNTAIENSEQNGGAQTKSTTESKK